jgi:hypothetical protein
VRLVQRLFQRVFVGELSTMPGCDSIAISHGVFRQHGEEGFGTAAAFERLMQIKELGYSATLCTVNLANLKELKILENTGWQQIANFTNPKTNHDVGLFFNIL